MKSRKIYYFMPILVFVFSFVLLNFFDVSYSASDKYYYIRRNMLSHHYIKNNKSNTASGTILVKTGSRTSSSSGTAKVVYCAEQGVNNSSSSHTKKKIKSVSNSLVSSKAKKELISWMPYAYPYISLSELKNYLKDETIGIQTSEYSKYNFDNLDAQESITAVQAAIWNSIKNTSKYVYGKTVSNISSSQSSFKIFGSINWQTCKGYNTGSGKYATILTAEEKEWYQASACKSSGDFYKNVYSVKKDGLSDERINTLIKWYDKLPSILANTDASEISDFSIKSATFTPNNGTLMLNVIIDSPLNEYKITFYDYDGNVVLATQNVTGNELGNEFIINNLPLTTSGIKAEIETTSKAMSVYYYQGSGQDWIGVDTTSGLDTTTLNILNDGSGQIIVYKVDSENINVDVSYEATTVDESKCGNDGCLPGAYFILYASDKETVIKEFISESTSTVIGNLPNGTYYLYEQESPYGYTKYNFTGENVDSEGYIKIDITNGNTASVIVNNDLVNICFTKIDSETKEMVDGATFRIEDAEGSVYEEFLISVQENNGVRCLNGQLDSGYYYLIEESAPANYVKTDKIFKFAVGKFNPDDIVIELEESETVVLVEGINEVVTIENDPGVVISKTDLSTGACVEGAKLVITNSNNEVVDEWTSSCVEGMDTHQIGLKSGQYTLTETITPSGYATSESITFTIDENGKSNKSLEMKDAPIEVCILKTSKDVSEGLIGAEFEIYKENGELYEKIVTDVTATCLPYMPVGNYILKEVKAPEGYKITNEDIKITVKDTNERQIFEIENELDVPKTDLDYSKIIIFIAALFMVFGLGLVGYYASKKRV